MKIVESPSTQNDEDFAALLDSVPDFPKIISSVLYAACSSAPLLQRTASIITVEEEIKIDTGKYIYIKNIENIFLFLKLIKK